MVRVLLGRDKGKKGKVLAVFPTKNYMIVDKVNVVKKHVRPKRSGEKGQRVSVAAPIHISDVQLVCPQCKKSTRVAIQKENDKPMRMCKKCKAVFE